MEICIVGYGAVATYAARHLREHVTLGAVIARPGREDAAREAVGSDVPVVHSVAGLFSRPDLVVDCAGHGGLRAHGADALRAGLDVLSVSVGALADEALRGQLEGAAREGGSQLHLVSGAIGALDALSAAAVDGLETVRYTGRKPPLGWTGSPAEARLDLAGLTQAEAHFQGTARDAALQYPKNANVAAAVALAGVGFEDTRVELIADPGVSANIHEVTAEGRFGRMTFRVEGNSLPGNPKSSALTAMSVVAEVRRRLAPITV